MTIEDILKIKDKEVSFLTISKVSALTGIHPQTIRQYDRIGLVKSFRTKGFSRRYSANDVLAFLQIRHLSLVESINLNGIMRIMELEKEVYYLRAQLISKESNIAFETSMDGNAQVIKNRRHFRAKRKKIKKIGYR